MQPEVEAVLHVADEGVRRQRAGAEHHRRDEQRQHYHGDQQAASLRPQRQRRAQRPPGRCPQTEGCSRIRRRTPRHDHLGRNCRRENGEAYGQSRFPAKAAEQVGGPVKNQPEQNEDDSGLEQTHFGLRANLPTSTLH